MAILAAFSAPQLYRPEWTRRSPSSGDTFNTDTLSLEADVIKEVGTSGGVVQVNVGEGKLSALQTTCTNGVPPATAIRGGDTASRSKSEMELKIRTKHVVHHVSWLWGSPFALAHTTQIQHSAHVCNYWSHHCHQPRPQLLTTPLSITNHAHSCLPHPLAPRTLTLHDQLSSLPCEPKAVGCHTRVVACVCPTHWGQL